MKRAYLSAGVAGMVAVGLVMMLSGCSDTPAPPADTSAADLKAIKDGEITWNSEFGAKDVDKVASHYADEASLMIPGQPLVAGKNGIHSAIQTLFADPDLKLSFTTVSADVSKSGDLAYTHGTYAMTSTNPKTKRVESETGKYVTVYRKQADGSWKVVADIDNADGPATIVAMAKGKKAAPAPKKKRHK
jgi:uncharacterized protein (TIGR02246 family)